MSASLSLRRALHAAAFLLLAFAFSARAALPAGVTEVASVEGITGYRLVNGLRVVLFPDAGSAARRTPTWRQR
ncbi:MAG TPA: hypothetical protein VMN56_00785 [Casimicrobiaceae bacterium]|nr:hypothetical protein [Casimicrobiaceae bacterium]